MVDVWNHDVNSLKTTGEYSAKLVLQKSCSSTHGIPLRISPFKKKLKITSTEYHQVFHKKLPPRRRWKKKTPKADVIFIEEDSNDDVDDDDAKRNVSCMFNDKVSWERKIRLRLFHFNVREISNIFLVSTGKLQTTVSTAYQEHNCVFYSHLYYALKTHARPAFIGFSLSINECFLMNQYNFFSGNQLFRWRLNCEWWQRAEDCFAG